MSTGQPRGYLALHITGSEGGFSLRWQWPGGGFTRGLDVAATGALEQQAEALRRHMAAGRSGARDLLELGANLGLAAVGREHASELRTALEAASHTLTVCEIWGTVPLVMLPWEALVLPDAGAPLMFTTGTRARIEFARTSAASSPAGRRVSEKCLAVSSNSPARALSTEREVDELKTQLQHHPVRFRSSINPDADEFSARLLLECSLLLFAGHGQLRDGSYSIELGSRLVNTADLAGSLRRSRAEVLVFDSCESGLGYSGVGLPGLFMTLPSATCLLGMQAVASDAVSRWFMPSAVTRLMLGEPIWSVLNALRLVLWEQHADSWFVPTIHLKDTYEPFIPRSGTWRYLIDVSKTTQGS